ncbi:MAG TPA: TadE family protein [Myxococcales bacterium]
MSREDARGQAAVETAIVAPLFVFTMMGLIQFTLLYQARALLKYAAYRAARAGAMMNACPTPMRTAALNVLLPVIALKDAYQPTRDLGTYAQAMIKTKAMNRYWDAPNVKIMDVTVCGPLKSWLEGENAFHPSNDQTEVDFDDPYNAPGTLKDGGLIGVDGGEAANLKGFERTRLRVQLRLNQKLIIPLANWVIFRAWMGMGTNKLIRMGDKNASIVKGSSQNKRLKYDSVATKNDVRWKSSSDVVKSNTNQLYIAAIAMKRYFIPLYANYGFRMQSNYYLEDCPLPESNQCFHYKSDDTNP